jgi:hypothetical protein
MAKCRGTFRLALTTAAQQLADVRCDGMTWRDIYDHTPMLPGLVPRVARRVVDNMARAGELQRVGIIKAPHARRPMTLFSVTSSGRTQAEAALECVLNGWIAAR